MLTLNKFLNTRMKNELRDHVRENAYLHGIGARKYAFGFVHIHFLFSLLTQLQQYK